MVPFAIQLKVKVELQHLQYSGTLSKVNWNEWNFDKMPENRSVFVCIDFKVTVNPLLHVDHYPAPRATVCLISWQ